MTPEKPKSDPRLIGVWKSDRRATLDEWRYTKRLSQQRLRKFMSIFGKLHLVYTAKRIRGTFDEYKFTQRYRVLGSDSDSVAICFEDRQLTKEWRIQHIHFHGQNRFWVAVGGNREWFKRVKRHDS